MRIRKRKTDRKCRPFSEFEKQVLYDNYPSGGTAACQDLLPMRTGPAIRTCAMRLGLRYGGPPNTGSKPNGDVAVPVPAHDYTPEDRAWMTTRLPVFSSLGAPRISA